MSKIVYKFRPDITAVFVDWALKKKKKKKINQLLSTVRGRPDYILADKEMKVPSAENVKRNVKDCLQVLSLG